MGACLRISNTDNAYLKKYEYANASAEDFWNTIAQVSGKPADRIMSSFVVQPGVPLVIFSESCDEGKTHVKLTQQRYLYDRKLLESESPEGWDIPVCVKGSTETCQLLTGSASSLTVPGCKPMYGNAGARGYYRTAYTDQLSQQLATTAENALTPAEAIMFTADTWGAIRIAREDVGAFLSLAHSFRFARSSALQSQVHNSLRYMGDYLTTAADRPQYQKWLRDELEPEMDKIGWSAGPDESEDIRQIRGYVLATLGLTADDPRAIAEAQSIAKKDLAKEPVDPTLVRSALMIAARHGDVQLFEAYLARLRSPLNPEDYIHYVGGITGFTQPALIQRALEFFLSPDTRSQDAIIAFTGMLSNPRSREQSWSFIREHWDAVEKKVTPFAAGYLVDAGGTFCDAKNRDEVKAFFTTHKIPTAGKRVDQAVERIDACIDLTSHQTRKLEAWLDAQGTKTHVGQ